MHRKSPVTPDSSKCVTGTGYSPLRCWCHDCLLESLVLEPIAKLSKSCFPVLWVGSVSGFPVCGGLAVHSLASWCPETAGRQGGEGSGSLLATGFRKPVFCSGHRVQEKLFVPQEDVIGADGTLAKLGQSKPSRQSPASTSPSIGPWGHCPALTVDTQWAVRRPRGCEKEDVFPQHRGLTWTGADFPNTG